MQIKMTIAGVSPLLMNRFPPFQRPVIEALLRKRYGIATHAYRWQGHAAPDDVQ